MAASRADADAERLHAQLAEERRRIRELTTLVQQEQKKVRRPAKCTTNAPCVTSFVFFCAVSQVDRVTSAQQTVENNISRLYDTARNEIDEQARSLSAARLQLTQDQANTSGLTRQDSQES